MVIVAGLPRSGTSIWMRLLAASGLPAVGEAFPALFGRPLHAANPEGFFESSLINGIHFASNPDPHTGALLRPDDPCCVKIFLHGLRRTERRYLRQVIWTYRHWGSFERSFREMDGLARASGLAPLLPEGMHPLALWASEILVTLLDMQVRDYSAIRVDLRDLQREPESTVARVFGELGLPVPAVSPWVGIEEKPLSKQADFLEAVYSLLGRPVRTTEVRALLAELSGMDFGGGNGNA